ncbi:MAG: hypothetical protein AAFY31_07055 [Pseudomonadota bacterium]
MSKSRRIAGLKVSRVAPTSTTPQHKSLPDLAPPEERLRTQKRHIFSSDEITLSREGFKEAALGPGVQTESKDLIERLTVYTLNMTVMVFAVPAGLALLLLNIIAGENLRTTAHVMALTGLFTALAAANPGLLSLTL